MNLTQVSSRGWVLAGVVMAVIIFAAAWLTVISPVHADASQLRVNTQDVAAQNAVLMTRNNQLGDQAKNQGRLVAELDVALQGLPTGAGLPVFSRQLATQAAARDLVLTGVSIGAPTAPTTTTATAPTPDAAAAPTTPSPSTQAMAVPITVTTTGPALQQLLFLRDVQQTGPRLALVTSTALAPAQGDGTTASIEDASLLTLQLTVFTNPLPKATRQQLAQLTQPVATS